MHFSFQKAHFDFLEKSSTLHIFISYSVYRMLNLLIDNNFYKVHMQSSVPLNNYILT